MNNKSASSCLIGLVFVANLARAAPTDLIINGSFETGDLSRWTTSGLGTTGTCPNLGRDWNVSNVPTATGCSQPGTPIDGLYAAYVMNDSGVADTTYTLSQGFRVPTGLRSASLSWSDSIISSYSGPSRRFSVDILAGAVLLDNVFAHAIANSDADSTWDRRVFDVSGILAAHAGDTLTLRFSNRIPGVWTGPAGLGLDNVSIVADIASVPEPGSLALVGLSLVGVVLSKRRRGRVGGEIGLAIPVAPDRTVGVDRRVAESGVSDAAHPRGRSPSSQCSRSASV